jgi:carbamoyltransferase
MNILGFSADWLGAHDASAAVLCDGVLVAAAEEERFGARKKHDGNLPFRAVDFCLRRAGIEMADVDVIAMPCKPFRSGRDSHLADMDRAFCKRLAREGTIRFRSLVHKVLLDSYRAMRLPMSLNLGMLPSIAAGLEALRARYACLPPVHYYDHHRAHAAAAYFTSGYDEAGVVTLDGRGGPYATVTWSASDDRLQRLAAEPFTNSLGFFYRDCTSHLGLGDFGEGKTLGLAAYGNSESLAGPVSSLLDTRGPGWYRYRRPPHRETLGFPAREAESALSYPYPDLAAACQSALERAVYRVAHSTVRATGGKKLCLGGGVALNCSSNGALMKSGLASSIWIFPATGDAGLSVGAAMLCAAEARELERTQMDNAFWGPDFSEAECEAALREASGVVFRRVPEIAQEIAQCLAGGETAGWFQGRMEFGPRALGNRSILADPRRLEMRDRINKLKGREKWRPLSPVVLAERASEFFNLSASSPFMLFATEVQPEKRAVVPAIVHVDGSARPQTVTGEQNSCLYDLLSAFSWRTGVPVLLNTSFNVAGEPIVCTPTDAIRTFLAAGLDVLALGDYVARRQPEVERIELVASDQQRSQ